MASPSSSTSLPNNTHAIRYDVFLSFRGEDTRHTFTDHLYHALLRAGLRTFRDDDEIDRGQQLQPEIETAIIQSRASIVVLSENYANSRWCLNELWLILDQQRRCNHFVLPVFYHVDPSDVRNQRRNFAIDDSKSTVDDVRRWKEALTELANLTGMVLSSSRSETDFITELVSTVQCKLDLKQLSTPAHLTGMDTRLEVINSWLRNEQFNAITICGMGGSGKTTLAQCIYNLNKQNFESSSFVEEIGKHYQHNLLRLQKQVLRDVLGGKKIMISSVSEGTHKIEEVLQKKKVLIVLDDIDDQEELNILLGASAFLKQSKIIITTRLLDLHAWFVSKSSRCMKYELKLLNDLESLELLSWHAFGSKIPMNGFEKLAIQLTKYCGGNPLALKVLGSSLSVSGEDPHKRNNMIQIWMDRMNSLNSLKGDIDCKIQDVLRKSFDCLQLNSQKELFLDIACFFVGESKDMVAILESDLYAKSGITTLINKCLLTVSPDSGKLMMHQLLQDMGRKIVCEESKDPAKRSRVWLDNESYRVLRKGDGSDKIEGLALNKRNIEQEMRSKVLALKTSSFAKMDNLKLLQLKYVKLTGSYKNFPELRWFCWHGCLLKTVHSGLLMSSLVALDMSYGHMEKFEVPKVINSLKILKLEGCYKLVGIRNLHRLPKLETLMLRNCSRLIHLCRSIGDHESLANLYLTGCAELLKALSSKKFVNELERLKALCIGGGIPEHQLLFLPRSLMVLDLSYCDLGYSDDVHVVFRGQSLLNLFLLGNPFEYLPNNIDLKMLRVLSLCSCRNLKSLPCVPSTLIELYIDGCESLKKITFQSGRFSLKQFSYEGCSNLSEVQGFFKLVLIASVDRGDLLQHMQWIKEYEDEVVDLAGDEITIGVRSKIQMLYEYGIMSIYMQGIEDQSIPTYEFISSSSSISFRVPSHQKKHRLLGLHVIYRSTKSMWGLLAKISNRTKGLTWVYNPVVYCKPRVDKDVVWLSYWPIGHTLDAGDEVIVNIFCEKGMIVVRCGACLLYMDDGKVEEEENCENENNWLKEAEVIGGDLCEFEVTRGGYYLCRRDLFGSDTSSKLKELFGDNVDYPESQGWRKTHQPRIRSYKSNFSRELLLRVDLHCERAIRKMMKAIYLVTNESIDSIFVDRVQGKLIVTGRVDPVAVVNCMRKIAYTEIISIYNL